MKIKFDDIAGYKEEKQALKRGRNYS